MNTVSKSSSPAMRRSRLQSQHRRSNGWVRPSLMLVLTAVTMILVTVKVVIACGPPPPIVCTRSTTLIKSHASSVPVYAGFDTVIFIPFTVFISANTGSVPPCPAPQFTTVTLTATCNPPPNSTPSSVTIPTFVPGFHTGSVPILIPAGIARRCVISGTATTTWAGGSTTQGTGDVTICVVDPAPGNPSVPRLDMQLISPPEVQAHPGDQRSHIVRIKNNDPVFPVTGMFTASSGQSGRLSILTPPAIPGSGETAGAAAAPFTGDAFPLDFGDELTGPCVLLGDPMTTTTVTINRAMTLLPGEERMVNIRQRSYHKCANGSCSETPLSFEGTFADTTPAFNCVQASFTVNTAVPPNFEWPDSGMMAFALPQPTGAVHYQANLPTHPVAAAVNYESTLQSPPNNLAFQGRTSVVSDQGFGNNKARLTHLYQVVGPPLNLGQPVQGSVILDIQSIIPGITATPIAAMLMPGDPGVEVSYFYITARSRLSGPGIPPTLDSFFDVFYSVSLDGITTTGRHIPLEIIPPSVIASLSGPSTVTATFSGQFLPGPVPGPIIRIEVHVDALGVAVGPPPRHDNCSGAYPLSNNVQFSADTTNAIGIADGPIGTCADGLVHAVWHTFTPTISGNYRIDTCGTNYDTVLVVFQGPDCNGLVEVACDDDSSSGTVAPCTPTGLASRIESVALLAGQTYFVRVGGFGSGNFGPYKVLVQLLTSPAPCCVGSCCTLTTQASCAGTWLGPTGTCSPSPCGTVVNDACASALPVGLGVPVTGTNCGATDDIGVSCGSGGPANTHKSVWYTFSPTHTAAYELNTCGSSFDTLLAVFQGGCAGPEVACNDDSTSVGNTPCPGAGLNSRILSVVLSSGQTYRIEVAAWSLSLTPPGGTYALVVNAVNPLGRCCIGIACSLTDAPACATGVFTAGGTCSPTACPPPGVCCRGATCSTAPALQTQATCAASVTGAAGGKFVVAPACGGANHVNPCCYADYSQNGTRDVGDIFNFLTDWFAARPWAIPGGNGTGVPAVGDIFLFLTDWFAGGC